MPVATWRCAQAGLDETDTQPRVRMRAERVVWALVATVGLFLLWSRFARVNTSLWNDEAYSAMTFVDRGPVSMYSGYYNPNNHLLFSLLSWATTNIVGHSEAAYRIWSVVPGIAAVGVVGSWARHRLRPLAGAAVIVLATMSSVHLVLSAQARGYGLGFLAGAGMLVAAMGVSDRGGRRDLALFGGFAAIGIWTLPQFAAAFVAHAGVLLVVRRDLRRRIFVTGCIVAAASLAFYISLLDQMVNTSQDDYGLTPLPWLSWINGPYSDLARPTLAPFLPDPLTSGPWLVVLYLAFGTLGVRWLWRRGERALLLLLVVPPIVTLVVLTIARVGFASRFISFLLFHLVVLLALGIAELWDLARPRAVRLLLVALAAGLVMVAGHNTVEYTRTLPFENAKRVKQIVDASGIDGLLFTNSTRPFALQYYFGQKRLKTRASLALSGFLPGSAWPGWAEDKFCNRSEPFVYVAHESPLAPEPDISCLRARHAKHVYVGPNLRGKMDVWLVAAR